ELMHQSLLQAKGDYNQLSYWSGLINSKNQTLTPNPDVIYLNPLYDTRQGSIVLEIPPAEGASSITGSVDDGWQTAIEDVGPAGVDKGKGGKYLILPPGYTNKVPAGYIPMPSSTYTGFVILRSNLTDGSQQDLTRAVDYGKKVKIYPYAQAANPPQTVFVDLLQTPFSNTIPYDLHFFETLSDFVQREPWLERDKVMIDQLKTIGIEKGKTFDPDQRTKEILTAAIKDAHKWVDQKYQTVFEPPFYEGTYWALPAFPDISKAIMSNYVGADTYPTDERAAVYSIAYFSTKHLGTGQYYLMTIKDSNGKPFDGSKLYKLHLPANVPVKLYWSVTIYDRETHALVKDMPYFSRASTTPGLQKNADGSVDVYFGGKAPEGKASNWIPANPKRGFEVLARFYGPEKEFFDQTWKMGNVEEVK
ncbi:MAG TPA: DUF1254 domain-containing protein, partial [Agriterribacter sp.]|nr:DUF1254 domain-containing protein [Agriterribacter sp.]